MKCSVWWITYFKRDLSLRRLISCSMLEWTEATAAWESFWGKCSALIWNVHILLYFSKTNYMVLQFLKLWMVDTIQRGISFPLIFSIIEPFMSDFGLCRTAASLFMELWRMCLSICSICPFICLSRWEDFLQSWRVKFRETTLLLKGSLARLFSTHAYTLYTQKCTHTHRHAHKWPVNVAVANSPLSS